MNATLQPLRAPFPRDAESVNSLRELHRLQRLRQHLAQARTGYVQLQERLATITDEPRWDVQVPLANTNLAFVPGQLIHTNTIKVALSDEYVVEYSAKQAAALARRREEQIAADIEKLEILLQEATITVDKAMKLPSDMGINEQNELVNEEGDVMYEIREELPPEASIDSAKSSLKATSSHGHTISALETPPRPKSFAKRRRVDFDKLADQLQAEEEAESNDNGELQSEEERHMEFRSATASTSKLSEPQNHARNIAVDGRAAEDTAQRAEYPSKSALARESRNEPVAALPTRSKSVSFDVPEAVVEEEQASKQKRDQPQSSPKIVQPFQNPVKSLVVEKPLPPSAPKMHPIQAPKQYSIETSDSEEEISDDSSEGSEHPSDDDLADIDELLLQREMALEYHSKRLGLGGAPGTSSLASADLNANNSWDIGQTEFVPLDASLATGNYTQSQPSRFRTGRLANASLIIPNLLQQANLKPGDIIDSLPLDGKMYTVDEEGLIQERIERMAGGETFDDIVNHQQSAAESIQQPLAAPKNDSRIEEKGPSMTSMPAVKETGLKNTVIERESKGAPTSNEKAASAPMRVSRFKAAQMAQA